MGGGRVTRPDFGMPQADPAHPMTEFYLLVQQALDREGTFALPGLYASFQSPARRIYAEEARAFCALSSVPREGYAQLLPPGRLRLLYVDLRVARDGTPAALLLTEESRRSTCAVRLLPPFVWDDPLPPLPDSTCALTVQLTGRDVADVDADPAAVCRRLVHGTEGKTWVDHPRVEVWLAEKVALLQRLYRR